MAIARQIPIRLFDSLNRNISKSPHLEFRKNGLGANKESRIEESRRYGRGICRWFLSKHCGISHFADIGNILGYKQGSNFRNATVTRKSKRGDLPDYLCADIKENKVFLAEAKGRQSREISFQDAEFKRWRKQLKRAKVTAGNNKAIAVKGYVVASQLRKRSKSIPWVSKVLCEDPTTVGVNGGRKA